MREIEKILRRVPVIFPVPTRPTLNAKVESGEWAGEKPRDENAFSNRYYVRWSAFVAWAESRQKGAGQKIASNPPWEKKKNLIAA